MEQIQNEITVETIGPGLYDISMAVRRFVADSGITQGLLTAFVRHTSASLTIQENADPDVQHDLIAFFERLVSRDMANYRHTMEGPDDMPAHIRSALTDVSLSIPVSDGAPVLGTWQGIYLFEHRDHAHQRRVFLHLSGI